MKVHLIQPPQFDFGKNGRFLEKGPIATYTMPLGLGYIASMLEKEGHEVSLVDAYTLKSPWDELEKIIKRDRPDVIGITSLSDQRASCYKLINLIKSVDPRIKVVLGGSHPTLMHAQILRNFPVDAIVIGEGEITMVDLLKAWDQNRSLNEVEGIAFSEGNTITRTTPRAMITNLDSIPFPAYHLTDFPVYKGWHFIDQIFNVMGINVADYQQAAIVTSRGCPGRCSFCSVHATWGPRWRNRSPQNIADEIELLQKRYNVKVLAVADDIFSFDQKRVMAICEEFLRRNIKIDWGFQTNVKYVSSEMLNLAARAGCKFIIYGVESASETLLKKISKNIRLDQIIKAFELTKGAGMVTGAFLMVGNIGENKATIRETVKLLKILKPDIIVPQILMICPGTELFETAKNQKFINDNYWLSDLPLPFYTYEHDLYTLARWYKELSYWNRGKFGRAARVVRDVIEFKTGIRLSRDGISWSDPAPEATPPYVGKRDYLVDNPLTSLSDERS